MKILIVTWTIPPTLTGSSVIVQNLAQGLGEGNVVLAGEGGRNTYKQIPNGTCFVHKMPPWGNRGARWWQWLCLPLIILRLIVVVKKNKITHILNVFPNEVFLIAALSASFLTRKPFYLWLHNTYLENRKGILRVIAKFVQALAFNKASRIFVMSDGMFRFYKTNYRDVYTAKMSVLPHVLNHPIVEAPHSLRSQQRYTLMFCGNVNESCRDALQRIVKTVKDDDRFNLALVTAVPHDLLKKWGIWYNGINVYSVPSGMASVELEKADILLLPHGFEGGLSSIEYETIFPTKTVDYLFSGKPIFAHSPHNSYLSEFLLDKDCAYVVTEKDIVKLKETLNSMISNESLTKQRVFNALKVANMFTTEAVCRELKGKIF